MQGNILLVTFGSKDRIRYLFSDAGEKFSPELPLIFGTELPCPSLESQV